MRTLEILLVLSPLAVGLLAGRSLVHPLAFLPALLLILHAAWEGLRWQMAPAYLLAILLLIWGGYPRLADPGRLGTAVGLLLILCAVAASSLLPVFQFPKTTGPFQVGTITRHLVDRSRSEPHEGVSGDREILIQIWYPSEDSGRKDYYRMWQETTLKTESLALVRTCASVGSSLAGRVTEYPVILFSPSWTGRHNQCTFQMLELASHGFVVVAINHPYSSEQTVYPDGRVVSTVLGPPLDFSSDEAWAVALQGLRGEISIRTDDFRFVLDQLERMQQPGQTDIFSGRIDLERIAVYGYSFGGAVAARLARDDRRVRAAGNLDGAHFDEPHAEPIGIPFLYFLSEETYIPETGEIEAAAGEHRRWLRFLAEDTQQIRESMEKAGGFWIRLLDSRHSNFCDSPLYTPLRRLTGAGTIPAQEAMKVVNSYLIAFFRSELLGHDEPLLHKTPSNPCIQFQRIGYTESD